MNSTVFVTGFTVPPWGMPLVPPFQRCWQLLTATCRRGGWAAAWTLALLAYLPCVAQPLTLAARAGAIDAMPATTVLMDAGGAMKLEDALARRGDFEVPQQSNVNQGGGSVVTWLRIPVLVARGEDPHWVLQIDYMLEQVDIHVVSGDEVTQHVALAASIPFVQRPFPARPYVVELNLEPLRRYEILMRVVDSSNALVPVSLLSPMEFQRLESREQMVQGVIAGIGLCLVLYSLAQWIGRREPMFAYYAIYVAGITMLSYSLFDLASQHLWRYSSWVPLHIPVLSVPLAQIGMVGFTERALTVRQWSPRISQMLAAIGIISMAYGGAFAFDLLTIDEASLVSCVTGPTMIVLAIYAAIMRARAGDRAALYLAGGWSIYLAGSVVFALTYQCLLPMTYWNLHSLQFVSVLDMCCWMLVLGMRTEQARTTTQRARVERDTLHSLAHTDALTGLPNRRGLVEVLRHAVPDSTPERLSAVYLLDLDGFKPINDRLGHDAGDALLSGVAQRLRQLVRASDTVARLGGDEFVVVASALPSETEAQRLGHKLLQGMRAPFEVAGQSCTVGLTIGYVLAPLDGHDPTELLKRADVAMYAGKHAGRQCIRRGAALSAVG